MSTEERRVVTVLFASVPGLARLAETLAAEDAAEVVDALFTRFRRAVEARGGTVDKFTATEVMGVFGAPVAHEDDAHRAVRAALAMRRELDLFNSQRGFELGLRAGINLGEVLWGAVGGDRPTAMGDAVNVASRLAGEASEGAIWVTRAVERATAGRIEYGEAREQAVRGRQDAVQVFEALKESEHATGVAPREMGSARIVGRDAEIARLLAAAESGRGTFVAIVGESGVGKTRLAQEVRARLHERHPKAWSGVGHAVEGAGVPLAPFAEIVRAAVRAEGGGAKDEVEETHAWMARLLQPVVSTTIDRSNFAHLMTQSLGQLSGETRVRHLDAGRVRQETQEAWEKWVLALAARGPVLLVLEDVHWADTTTLTLLDHLAARLAGAPVAILATARPGSRLPIRFERLPLAELPAEHTRALARDLFARDLDADLASFLVDQSGGNPHFLEELARHLRERDLVGGSPLRFQSRPDRLPDGLRGLLVSRIDAVSPEAREALKCGSVFERQFWLAPTAAIAGRDVTGPIELAERRLLVERQAASLLPKDVEFAFRQTSMREAAYSLLTKKERQRLHQRAAELLEPFAAALGRRILILAARHREAAGDATAAGALWTRAADDANGQALGEEALASAREARRLGAGLEAVLATSRALVMVGNPDAALEELEGFRRQTSAAGLDAHRLDFQRCRALDRLGRFEEEDEILARLQAAAGVPPAFALEVLQQRAHVLLRLSRFDDSLTLSTVVRDRVLEDLRAGRPVQRTLASVLNNIARTLFQKGDYDGAMRTYREAHDLHAACGDRHSVATVLNGMGIVWHALDEIDRALECYGMALGIYREVGDRWHIAMVLTNVANVRFTTGELELWREAWQEGLSLSRQVGDLWGEALIQQNLCQQLGMLGELEAALAAGREALEGNRAAGDRQAVAVTLEHLAVVLVDLDRLEEALASVRESSASLRELGARPRRLAQSCLTEVCVLEVLGRAEDASRAAEELATALDPDSERRIGAMVWVRVAALRRRLGRPGAREAADRALEIAIRVGARQEEAFARVEQAAQRGEAGAVRSAVREALARPDVRWFPRDRAALLESAAEALEAAGDREGALAAAREGESLAAQGNAPLARRRFRELLARIAPVR